MVGTSRTLLSRAVKEAQLADHLLNVTYTVTEDPRILLNVMQHSCRAMEAISEAVDCGKVTAADEALTVNNRFREALAHYQTAPTAFARKQQLVIASDGFSKIEQLNLEDIKEGVQILMNFVYQAGKHLLTDGR